MRSASMCVHVQRIKKAPRLTRPGGFFSSLRSISRRAKSSNRKSVEAMASSQGQYNATASSCQAAARAQPPDVGGVGGSGGQRLERAAAAAASTAASKRPSRYPISYAARSCCSCVPVSWATGPALKAGPFFRPDRIEKMLMWKPPNRPKHKDGSQAGQSATRAAVQQASRLCGTLQQRHTCGPCAARGSAVWTAARSA